MSHYTKVGYTSVTINVLSNHACNSELNDTFLQIQKFSYLETRHNLQNIKCGDL